MEAAVTRVLMGRYRLGGLLGRGGMAEVYDGYDERLGRPVAVKLLRPDMADRTEVRTRFEVEGRHAAQLSHPNVVSVYDTGEDAGTPFIVMERLPGETLADRMASGPVDQAWLTRVAGDVLAALGAAHAAGIVHRDVKPGNILLTREGRAMVADFGIAKSAEVAAGDATAVGMLLGTPAYLAPERLDGLPATPASDLYSLGVVLYEALAGVKPFAGTTPLAVASAVAGGPPPPLESLRAGVDPGLAEAVRRAMAVDPAGRPRSASAMARLLDQPTAPHPADATVVAGPGLVASLPLPRRGSGRRRAWWLAAAAAALVLVFVGVAMAGRSPMDGGPAGRLREVAGQLDAGDGPQGAEASARLGEVADQVQAGGGSDAASALLADVAEWRRGDLLSESATAAVAGVLGLLPGVAPTTTTTLPATTVATVAPTAPPDEGRGRGRNKDHGND